VIGTEPGAPLASGHRSCNSDDEIRNDEIRNDEIRNDEIRMAAPTGSAPVTTASDQVLEAHDVVVADAHEHIVAGPTAAIRL
jgi:hypothetical protein